MWYCDFPYYLVKKQCQNITCYHSCASKHRPVQCCRAAPVWLWKVLACLLSETIPTAVILWYFLVVCEYTLVEPLLIILRYEDSSVISLISLVSTIPGRDTADLYPICCRPDPVQLAQTIQLVSVALRAVCVWPWEELECLQSKNSPPAVILWYF